MVESSVTGKNAVILAADIMRQMIAPPAVLVGLACFSCAAIAGPLHDAASSGDLSAIERALEKGENVNSRNSDGKTPLYLATATNHLKIIKLLLDRGADPNRPNVGIQGPIDAPIHAAVRSGNLQAIRILAEANADLTLAPAIYGPAPLHLALRLKQVKAAVLLRKLGAGNYAAPSVREMLAKADLDLGERLAKGTCNSCHALQRDGKPTGGYGSGFGPTLWNIVGREKASLPGEKYSAAMRAQKGVWTYDQINNFLANPTASVPGTTSWYLLKNQRLRAAVIAYLRTLSDNPKPLP